jgi:hypothetical protein
MLLLPRRSRGIVSGDESRNEASCKIPVNSWLI